MTMSSVACMAIIFLTFQEVATAPLPDLDFYNPASWEDKQKMKQWSEILISAKNEVPNPNTACHRLLSESCQNQQSPRCSYFWDAYRLGKTSPGLSRGESLAVTMYTSNFYTEYNDASAKGNWQPYRIHTYLLYCAIQKLSRNPAYKVKTGEILYRNLRTKVQKPNVPRIFWKTFTSTSLDEKKADQFGMETYMKFFPQASKFGARVDHLSIYPNEKEVLLSPFEAFDVLPQDYYNPKNHINFRSSNDQEFDYLKYICQ